VPSEHADDGPALDDDGMSLSDRTDLTALVLVGSLSPSPAESSSELLGRQLLEALGEHGVTGTVVRVVDHDIKPGVEKDMGPGDAWPKIREQMLAADILVIATPIWMGQPSSVTKRVLERLDAEISEKDDAGRNLTFGKVAAVAVVGNEDGAHHTSAQIFQALNDVGFSLAASAVTYWVGEAMQGVDYKDLDKTPDEVSSTTKTVAANAAHLARVLKISQYPPVG
jgi:multimeric flavodoxin WrbA